MALRRGDVVRHLEQHLRKLDAKQARGNVLMLVAAVPLLFPAPLLFGTLYWLVDIGRLPPPHIRWTMAFVWACVIGIPAMIAVAWLTRGNATDAVVEESGGLSPSPFSMRNRAAANLLILDVLMLPYRLAVFAVRRHRARATVGVVDHQRMADALTVLLSSELAVPPAKLLKADEDPAVLTAIFAYLLHHELIGISSEGDTVWISSDAKERLMRMLGR